jgi:hypothetical protein
LAGTGYFTGTGKTMRALFFFVFLFLAAIHNFARQDTIRVHMNIENDQDLFNNDGGFEGGINTEALFFRSVSPGFNGVVMYEWTGINDTTHWMDKVHIIDQVVCQCENGFPVSCLQLVYNYRIGETIHEKRIEKKGLFEKGRPAHLTYYHDSGTIASIQQLTTQDGLPYSNFVSFNEAGDTIVTGSYLDSKMHGRWCNYEYNLSVRIPVYERWDQGKLVDIENSNILFVGSEGTFISKKKFLKAIGSYPNWYVIGLNPAQRDMSGGYMVVMIIYSSTFDPDDQRTLNYMLQKR